MPGARGSTGAAGPRGPPGDAGRAGEPGAAGLRVSLLLSSSFEQYKRDLNSLNLLDHRNTSRGEQACGLYSNG